MFIPNGISVGLSVSGTAQRVDISSADTETGCIRFYSEVRAACVKFGDSTIVATAPDDLQLCKENETFLKIPKGCTHFSIVTYGASGLVNYAIGQ